MDYQGITIERLNHSGFKIKNSRAIFIDPYKIPDSGAEPADFIFISHEHFDHCSSDDLKKISTSQTIIIATPSSRGSLKGILHQEIRYVRPGDHFELEEVKVEVVPAYNLNKFKAPGVVYHPKEDGKVGYLIEISGETKSVRFYHAGDTDNISEMKALKNVDVAFLPVSGTYVMTVEEAVEATKAIKPKLAIPMHYGAIVGTAEDAKRFKDLVKENLPTVAVEIL